MIRLGWRRAHLSQRGGSWPTMSNWVAYALTLSTAVIATVTRWHPMYLILIGAVLGLLGLI